MGEVQVIGMKPDPSEIARQWWLESDGRRVPGQSDGVTVFEIIFQDECRYFGFTGASVFEQVVDVRANPFISEHCQQMAYVVRCVRSGLDRRGGRELRDQLVAQAPEGSFRIDGTTVTTADCCVHREANDVEVMSFAEWVKTNDGGVK